MAVVIHIFSEMLTRQKPQNCSQEVRNDVTVINHLGTLGDCVEDLEVVVDILIDLHDGGDVTTPIAVVRSGPDGH